MDAQIIGRQEPSEIVLRARSLAGEHLEKLFVKFNDGKSDQFERLHWVKPELTSPSFEHFTFGYKSAVFAVLVDVLVDGQSKIPSQKIELLCQESLKYNLVPCLFEVVYSKIKPDENGLYSGVYGKASYNLRVPTLGWNLRHARTGELIEPMTFGKDYNVQMSEWELRNFAIGVVRSYGIEKAGYIFDSFCDIPDIDPQIWFHDNSGRRSWVIVRFQRKLDESAVEDFSDFTKKHSYLVEYDGYFAPVSAAMADVVAYNNISEEMIPLSRRFDGSAPLYRGHGMYVNFQRMIKIHSAK